MSRFHNALGRPAQTEFRHAVLLRDGFRCQVCGKLGGILEAHHIEALEHGGEHHIDNGQTVCRAPCHFDLHRPTPRADKVVWDKLLTRLLLSA